MQSSAQDVARYIDQAPAYSKPEKIDFSVVESMLRATSGSRGPVC